MDNKKIGLFIAEKRKNQNLTQKQLADKIGVTDKAVSRWETGKGMPEVSLLQPLSEALGVSLCELLNGETVEQNDNSKITDEIIVDTLKTADEKNKIVKFLVAVLAFVLLAAVLVIVGFAVGDLKEKTAQTFDVSYSFKALLITIIFMVLTGVLAGFVSMQNGENRKIRILKFVFIILPSLCFMFAWLFAFTPASAIVPMIYYKHINMFCTFGSVIFGAMLFNRIRELIKRK
ncbi:MAG: helix-turn-helix transcriptional regulator [Clostridia bacterium]|nr:helix-turn-helix transcriptional regulator [Clostridia bacterium]